MMDAWNDGAIQYTNDCLNDRDDAELVGRVDCGKKFPRDTGFGVFLDRLLKSGLVFWRWAYSASTFASRAMAILFLSSLKSKDLIT